MVGHVQPRDWGHILSAAERIVGEYPYQITLRQLHNRLVQTAGLGYRNDGNEYKQLSARTAEGRREGTFPALLDQTREIHRPAFWTRPADALRALAAQYRRDRTEGQEVLVVLGGEKATLLAQLGAWFGPLGMPIVLLRGYGSQTYLDDVSAMLEEDGREAVLIDAGDFDPSGEDILRDFTERCDGWIEVEHIAIRPEQINELVRNPGKATDSRAASFTARHGELVQVEVEAIPPQTLRDLYDAAVNRWLDTSNLEATRAREEAERARLEALAAAEEQS
jgi:hypothetical protein